LRRVRSWGPLDDYFGRPRGLLPLAGAVERKAGAIVPGIKPR